MQQSETETNMATRIDKNTPATANRLWLRHQASCVEECEEEERLQDASDCQGKANFNAVTWRVHKQIAG